MSACIVLSLIHLSGHLSRLEGMGVNRPRCLAYAGFNGNYWSARAYSAGQGCNLNFNSGNVNPRNTNQRAYGFAARPVSAFTA